MKQIFLDTETTGLRPNDGDRVVEIAAVAYEERRRLAAEEGGEYHQYINPKRDMPAEALAIHGLSDDFLADKPVFAKIADSFLAFIKDSELIIHNAAFDRGFLDAELKRLGKPPLEKTAAAITCSLEWSRTNNHNIAAHSLDALCRHFNIRLDARKEYHSAIVDTRLLGEVYFRMRQKQGEIEMANPPLQVAATGGAVPVRLATAQEISAHDALLAEMEKDTGTPPLYTQHSR